MSNDIIIYTIKTNIADKSVKLVKVLLNDVWNSDNKIRINNFGDKDNTAHSDKDIKEQIAFAQKTKKMLWNNSQHFAFFCRYGERQQDKRTRHVSVCLLTCLIVHKLRRFNPLSNVTNENSSLLNTFYIVDISIALDAF